MGVLDLDEDALFEDLARQAIGTSFAQDLIAGRVAGEDEPVGLDSLDVLRSIGRRIFSRISREMYEMFCGNQGDSKERRKNLMDAIGVSDFIALAFLTNLINQHMGISAALSSVAAAILIKSIIRPCGDELCDYWLSCL